MTKKKTYQLSQWLFVLFMVILLVPVMQWIFRPVEVPPLKGDIHLVEQPQITVGGWFDETLQQNTESWVNQHFGFRNTLVRLYNQWRFWLYGKSSARGVLIGKQNYLYEENYIKAYYGRDFVGDSLIHARVETLKKIQDTLQSIGKTMVICIAPGKGQFYPDYIPDNMRSDPSVTNYQTLIKEAKKQGLELIDFNAWFLQMKDTSRYPLYPKTGIHWSHYGSELALDSLLRYIEQRQHVDIPDFVVKRRYVPDEMMAPEADIEEGMNLLVDLDRFPMVYSDVTIENQEKPKLKIMVVSDSFFWQLHNRGFMSSVFDDGQFWYYNQTIYQPTLPAGRSVESADVRQELLDKDVIVLLTTDANLPAFPWGFDALAYRTLFVNDSAYQAQREEKIQGYIFAIKNTEAWLEQVRQKAIERQLPLDSMIRIDATYMVDMDEKKE
jgi:hypothetical protein